jgi:hypothetical protein
LASAEAENAEGEEGAGHKKKKREFDEKIFFRKWDAEFPKIDVPAPVVDDIDNDYDLIDSEQN